MDYTGKKILILAGQPRERVDTFRFYVNDTRPASQGLAAAKTLRDAGAEVTVVAPTAQKFKAEGVRMVDTLPDGKEITSARHMLEACRPLSETGSFDVVVQLASVSSLTCPAPSDVKIQKTDASSRGQLFDVTGNVAIDRTLQEIFPTASVAGYDTHGQWFQNKASGMNDALHDIAQSANTQAQAQVPAPSRAKTASLPINGKLSGKHIVVTTSRTEEKLTTDGDKITNFFSGRQGQAIATAFADMGAHVTLISGPTQLPDVNHPNVKTVHVVSARQMHAASQQALQSTVDAFIGAAAVADFGMEKPIGDRLQEGEVKTLELTENPSIVGGAANHSRRPQVVVSFAAQSPQTILEYAKKKFHKLGVDLTVANPIGDTTIAARDPTRNQVMLITQDGVDTLPEMSKSEVARTIAENVARQLLKAKPVKPRGADEPPAAQAQR